jgi:hypothetical protein
MSKHSVVCGVLACLLAPVAVAEEKKDGESRLFFRLGEESSVGQNSRVLLKDNTIFWTGAHEDFVRPTGPFDLELPVLAFRSLKDNKLRALLFNHSTHTIGTRKGAVRSPSFYGLAAQELESDLGGTVCFLEGASGSTHNLFLKTDEMVIRIKNAVREALDAAEPWRSVNQRSSQTPIKASKASGAAFSSSINERFRRGQLRYCRCQMSIGGDVA